jgi:hypothetical protein
MDEHSYLSQVPEEVQPTWHAMGEIKVNKNTKFYAEHSIVLVDCSDGDGLSSAPLHNRFLYVVNSYIVDNKVRFDIDWATMSPDDVTGMHVATEGIMLPFFLIVGPKYDVSMVYDKNFIPYSNQNITIDNGCINISDDELNTILTSIGFPFVTFSDIELAKNEIIKYCIKPAMQRYFTYRPILIEQPGWPVAKGSEFMVEFPRDAYACIPYYTVPGGTSGNGPGQSPFAFYNEQMLYGGLGGMGYGGRFGRGVHYHGKQVPGYVGLDWRNTMLDAMQANQGFLNFFRREKYSRKKIGDKLFAYGFSTIGGNLNFKWLCSSNNWDDVKFEDLENLARPMARIEVLNNIGMLRSLIKQDIAGKLDESVLTTKADKLDEQVRKITDSIGITGLYSTMRGGS